MRCNLCWRPSRGASRSFSSEILLGTSSSLLNASLKRMPIPNRKDDRGYHTTLRHTPYTFDATRGSMALTPHGFPWQRWWLEAERVAHVAIMYRVLLPVSTSVHN